jgi:hypothetical protein
VAPGLIVVNGREMRGIWDYRGQRVGENRRGRGGSWLDFGRGRLLAEDPEGGLSTYTLPDGRRDAAVMLAFPEGQVTKEILEGPDGLVLVSAKESPFGAAPEVLVEAVRVRDYADKSKQGTLRGIDPLAGIIRDKDGRARTAAARTGPVLATEDGILWCDWRLAPLYEQPVVGTPLALSVDSRGFACLLSDVEGTVWFRIVPPGGPVVAEVELNWSSDVVQTPPLVAADGQIFLTSPDVVMAFSPEGPLLWKQSRNSAAPATITSNGILLLADGDLLYAVSGEGRRRSIWHPPAPLATAAVLAGGKLHAATAESLFVLAPAS